MIQKKNKMRHSTKVYNTTNIFVCQLFLGDFYYYFLLALKYLFGGLNLVINCECLTSCLDVVYIYRDFLSMHYGLSPRLI